MPRLTLVLICALTAFTVNAAAPAVVPAQDLSGTLTLPYDASLQEAPSDDALSRGILPTGALVTMTGDPVDGYYPVSVDGATGWVRADALALTEIPAGVGADTAAPAPAAATPVAPIVTPAEDTGDPAPPVEGEPVADVATDVAPGSEVAAPAPELSPNAPPVDVPDPGPTGPAAVTVDAAIFAGPGPDYGVLGTANAGALVEQTGHAVSGYVTVRYIGVTGWVSLDHLAPPPAAASS